MERYDIVVSGQIRAGFERQEVVRQLAALFKCQAEKAAHLVAGKAVTLKKGIDREAAEVYGRQLHKTGIELQVKRSAAATAVVPRPAAAPPQMTCPKCGTAQPKNESCIRCGILVARYQSAPSAASAAYAERPSAEPSRLDELEAFVDHNFAAYQGLFLQLNNSGAKFAVHWNWAGFLIAVPWMIYRKMYLYALIFLGIAFIPLPGLGLIMTLLCGFLGNSLYYHHCSRKIAAVNERGADRARTIAGQGGVTSIPVVIVVTIVLGMAISALYTRVYLGDRLDALYASQPQQTAMTENGEPSRTRMKMALLGQTLQFAKFAEKAQQRTFTPPESMAEIRTLFRLDAQGASDEWGTELAFFRELDGTAVFISAGPDRSFETEDDLSHEFQM